MIVGSARGLQLRFEGGLLRALLTVPHRKDATFVTESLSNAAPSELEPAVKSNVPPQRDASSATRGDVWRSRQRLSNGTRLVELRQFRERRPEAQPDMLAADVEFRFELSGCAVWNLLLPQAKSADHDSIGRFVLPSRLTFDVDASAASLSVIQEAEQIRLAAQLPSGTSSIRFTIRSVPAFAFGNAVVFCRPDQIREAAIVVSCIGGAGCTPVLPLHPPPMSDEEYTTTYESYESLRKEILELTATDLAWREAVNKQRVSEAQGLSSRRDALQERLAPYRSWITRNDLLSKMVGQAGFDYCVFLFEPQTSDFRTMDPVWSQDFQRFTSAVTGEDSQSMHEPLSTLSSKRIFFLEAPSPRDKRPDAKSDREDHFYYNDPAELLRKAWSVFRPSSALPDAAIDVGFDDLAAWPIALLHALRGGLPLRCAAADAQPTILDQAGKDDSDRSDEAVLIENVRDADVLLGVAYAHHRNAKLIMIPKPDLDRVARAFESYQKRIEAASKMIGRKEVDFRSDEAREVLGMPLHTSASELKSVLPETLLQALRDFLTGTVRFAPTIELEAAVAEQIPAWVAEVVADRRVSAFTRGLPYSFFRTDNADWSRKPIGHVAGDWALIVMSEILSDGLEAPELELGAIFDPGFFRTSETSDVFDALRRCFAYPLVLTEKAASLSSLQTLSRMELAFVFFNTHGSDDAIVLSDGSLPNHLIAQWLHLLSRPIVFNNSCLSWTGVGREFIRTGARGYIGTLWSIPAKTAADFARTVAKRILVDGEPICQAMLNTPVESGTERAYIYVGTANAHLARGPANLATGDVHPPVSVASKLFELGATARSELGILLYKEGRKVLDSAIREHRATGLDLVDLVLDELSLIVKNPDLVRDDPGRKSEVFSLCAAALDALSIDKHTINARRSRFYDLKGTDYEMQGDPVAALRSYRLCVDNAVEADADVHVRMAQILYRQGSVTEAKTFALRAKEQTEQRGDLDRMYALGVLVQISRRLHEYEAGLEYAAVGYHLAADLRQFRQQALFRQDQANIYLALGDTDRAISAAEDQLKFLRIAQDDDAELFAYEQLYRCWFAKGEIEKAEHFARMGLEHSRAGANHELTPAFLRALGDIARRRGTPRLAVDEYLRAIELYSSGRRFDLAAAIAKNVCDLAAELSDSALLWKVLALEVELTGTCAESVQSALIEWIYDGLKKALLVGSVGDYRSGLDRTWTAAMSYEQGAETHELGPYRLFVRDLVLAFGQWILGNVDNALELGAILDERSDGRLGIADYFRALNAKAARGATVPAKRPGFWKRLLS